jgi:hypothetical protein
MKPKTNPESRAMTHTADDMKVQGPVRRKEETTGPTSKIKSQARWCSPGLVHM